MGNFYYHFRFKDAILDAVIGARVARIRRRLEQWEAEASTPVGCVMRFVEIVLTNRANILDYGCSMGTLATELAKLEHAMLPQAGRLFTLFRAWLRDQFVLLGQAEQAAELAMRVLIFSQGVVVMARRVPRRGLHPAGKWWRGRRGFLFGSGGFRDL